jgi:hypothetical protein
VDERDLAPLPFAPSRGVVNPFEQWAVWALAFFLEPLETFQFAVVESPYRLGVDDEPHCGQHKHNDYAGDQP